MGCCCGGDGEETEGDQYGKPNAYKADFKGPVKNRSCTDILCCLIFLAFIAGYIVIALFAWLNGDPIILLYPTDNQGRICGVGYTDLDLSNHTSLFFFDMTRCASPATLLQFQCLTTQICVESCPNEFWTYFPDVAQLELHLNIPGTTRQAAADALGDERWSKYICTYGFNAKNEFINGMGLQEMITAEHCASYYVPYSSVVGRCIPSIDQVASAAGVLTDAAGAVPTDTIVDATGANVTATGLVNGSQAIQYYLEARDIADKLFADLNTSWQWLLIMLAVAAFVAFIWIVLMRWITGVLVWVTLLGLIGLLSFGVWYCYDEYNSLKNTPGSNTDIMSVGFTTQLGTYLALTDTWLAFMIILGVLDLILILVVIFLRKRIAIAIKIIAEASKAIGCMISTLFFPIVTFLLLLIVVAFWAITALFLASTGDPVYQVIDASNVTNLTGQTCNVAEWQNSTHQYYNDPNVTCAFIKYGGESLFHQNVVWLQVIQVFGMLWLANWVLALGQATAAGAFASYYWAFNKPQDIPWLPVYSSFGRAIRYHTGSLAFGAFIIAVVQLIRMMLEYIDYKLKDSENKVAKCLVKCLRCCFWCLEKFLKFLNTNAYIMISVYGKNFCWSAKEAFKLLMRNILRVAVIDKVTDFIIFVGKMVVTVGMGSLAWAFFTDKFSTTGIAVLSAPTLNYYWFMIGIVVLATYFIASGFFETFTMAVDTIFLCFLEDLERNDGSEQKPYFMSKSLKSLMGKKNKKPKPDSE